MLLDPEFPPDIRVENEAQCLIEAGHEVHILSYNFGLKTSSEIFKGIHTHRLTIVRRKEDELENCYPSIIPNWDHSPRSGRKGHIFINSTPQAFKKHVKSILAAVKNKKPDHQIIFLKSWNEWAEGNYIEPDLKYGRGHLEALKKAIQESKQ